VRIAAREPLAARPGVLLQPGPTGVNPAVTAVSPPPIADVQAWVAGREFPPHRPLLDVAQAVPGYPPAAALVEHVARTAADPASAAYSPITGLAALRAAFASHLAGIYEAPVDAADVAITAGCNQAFCVALSALAGRGQRVVLPVPWYFNHAMWLQMQGVHTVALPFDEARGGVPDIDAVETLLTPGTAALVLVTPNNPTGAEYPPSLLEHCLELCAARGAVLVLDETYKDFRRRKGPPHRLLAHPGWREHLVSLHSFSKSYAMAGYRVGALVCGPGLMPEVSKVMDCVAICAPQLGQRAAAFALQHLDAWRDQKVALMAERLAALGDAFRSNALRYRLVSAGAYFAWVRHPFEGQDSATVARRLAQEHGVLCVPGSTFGPGLEGYLRFAFANLEAQAMAALVARLAESQRCA
jgi:aspartate/methionine/tyrosine aminotransferase